MLLPLPQICLHNLTYYIPQTTIGFADLTLSLNQQKIGIVGDNGVGKTTLLHLIAGDLAPTQGVVTVQGTLAYVPQQYQAAHQETVASILGIQDQLHALSQIAKGNLSQSHYELIGDDWDLEQRIQQYLHDFGLLNIDLYRSFLSLSGGQRTQLLLMRAILACSDIILLDEPTNNLDQTAREKLYKFIQNASQQILVVSHDRELLNVMDHVLEITTHGIQQYGGNYNFYLEQKALYESALERQHADAKKEIKKTTQSIQQSIEKWQQRRAKGRQDARQQRVDKMLGNFRNERSERTQARMAKQEIRLLGYAANNFNEVKNKLEVKHHITVNLQATEVPNGKIVLYIEDVCFQYPNAKNYLFNSVNLKITGAEHLLLTGNNGSGKTSLIKLILGQLTPQAGKIYVGVQHIAYLDQDLTLLNPEQTLLENFQQKNPNLSLVDAYRALAQFMFRNKAAEKLVKNLSGGERIRAGLACSLMSAMPPQLLILDEPTNHLDIRSIQAIEAVLANYRGAIIIISHDKQFVQQIGITRVIRL